MPIVSVPLLFAICGFRSSQKSVLTGMGAGFITVVCWNVWMTELNIDSVIPGVVANILFSKARINISLFCICSFPNYLR